MADPARPAPDEGATPATPATPATELVSELVSELAAAGVVAAAEEAGELLAAAGSDRAALQGLLDRRRTGEPLAWLTGRAAFCGLDLVCRPGVYVPRWQSQPLAERAAARLPSRGTAVDVATGSGAVAAVLAERRPEARVVATEVDAGAAACAAANGVRVVRADLVAPLHPALDGTVDVVVAVLPYVPTAALRFLPRDTLAFETTSAYDGGPDGCRLLRRLLPGAARLLRPGGTLLVELGGEEVEALADDLSRHGFVVVDVLTDGDGDVRGVEAGRAG